VLFTTIIKASNSRTINMMVMIIDLLEYMIAGEAQVKLPVNDFDAAAVSRVAVGSIMGRDHNDRRAWGSAGMSTATYINVTSRPPTRTITRM